MLTSGVARIVALCVHAGMRSWELRCVHAVPSNRKTVPVGSRCCCVHRGKVSLMGVSLIGVSLTSVQAIALLINNVPCNLQVLPLLLHSCVPVVTPTNTQTHKHAIPQSICAGTFLPFATCAAQSCDKVQTRSVASRATLTCVHRVRHRHLKAPLTWPHAQSLVTRAVVSVLDSHFVPYARCVLECEVGRLSTRLVG
jgi:hypothetical protein